MSWIYGDYLEPKEQNQEYLKLAFLPSSLPLQHRWRNNGLSADFLADYLSTFLPREDSKEATDLKNEVKDAVSFVANELLENAMKFSYVPERYPVSITMQLEKDNIIFYVKNSVENGGVDRYRALIQRLLTEDPNDLYMEQLMANAEGENEGGSGLGFLAMINDYNARVAWKFEPASDDPQTMIVTTMVGLGI
ncbi:MAG: ATP-binding protein [Caldilineaceae bacterium]|nr:ATP-binding protein [Caldilineaceae bacterium]